MSGTHSKQRRAQNNVTDGSSRKQSAFVYERKQKKTVYIERWSQTKNRSSNYTQWGAAISGRELASIKKRLEAVLQEKRLLQTWCSCFAVLKLHAKIILPTRSEGQNAQG